jgi:S-layer protein
MAVSFTSGNDFITPTVNGQTYLGGAGNDTYILSSQIEADATVVIQDTEGDNKIQLIDGLEITSSLVTSNAIELTLSNGAKVQILGANNLTFELGGNPLNGEPGVQQDFTTFVQDTLGTTVPAPGETPSAGGEVVIGDEPEPVYTLAADAESVDEGATATFTLTTENVDEGTEVAYTISGVDAADVDGDLTGVATVGADGTATIQVSVAADETTEGEETLTVSIDGTDATADVVVNDTSLDPVFELLADAALVDEGNAASFSLNNGIPNTEYTYTISGVAADDIEGDLTDTVTTDADGNATITVALVADRTTEGQETLTVKIPNTGLTASTTVNDTSLDNVAPVVEDAAIAVDEAGDAVEGQLVAQDPDEDGVEFTWAEDVDGLTIDADGSYTFDPSMNPAAQALTYADDDLVIDVPFTVTDDYAADPQAADGTLTITVAPTPLTFELVASADFVEEGSTVTYTLVASEAVQSEFTGTIKVIAGDGTAGQTVAADFGSGSLNPVTVTIPVGETESTVMTLTPTNDAATEAPESYTVVGTIDGTEYVLDGEVRDPSTVGGLGQTFTLTTGVDYIPGLIGSAGSTGTDGNDTIKADYDVSVGAHTLSGLDDLDGGFGDDILKITDAAGGTVDVSLPQSVKNIETVTVASVNTLSGNTADISGWTDVTDATFTLKSATVQAVTVADTTDVTVTNSLGGVTVTDGASQTVTGKGVTGTTSTLAGSEGAVTATFTAVQNDDNGILITGGTDVTLTATEDAAVIGAGDVVAEVVIGGAGALAPSGAVDVTYTGAYTDGADDTLNNIEVTGGTTVSVDVNTGITAAQETAALTDATNFTLTQSDVKVTGSGDTTEVTVTQDDVVAEVDYSAGPPVVDGKIGVDAGDVTIADKNAASTTAANTITTVTLDNFGAATVDSAALTTLNLMGTGTSVTVTQGALTTPTITEQTVNAEDLTLTGALTLDNDIKTANIDVTGEVDLQGTQVIAGATTINVTGTGNLDSAGETFTALTALNITNTGSTTLGTQLGNGVTVTAAGGAEDLTFGATTKANTLGAGDDTVAVNASAITGTIDAGADTDTLVMSDANAVIASSTDTFEGKISNFERLALTGTTASAQTVNLANLDSINTIAIVDGVNSGNTLTLSNVTSGVNVSADSGAAGTLDVTQVTDDTSATAADVINFSMSNSTAQTVFKLDASEFETINVASDDSATTATGMAHVITTLDASAAKSLNISGDAGLTITTLTGTALTTIDASGVTKGDVSFTTGALAAAATIDGGAGDDSIDASAATKAVTLSGNDGDDLLIGGAVADTISGGAGDDVIFGDAGADTLTGNAGADIFAVTTATDSNGVNSDTISDFTVGEDQIGLLIGSGGEAVTYLGEASAYGSVLTSFSGTANEAVLDTSTNTVYVDVDGSQTLDTSDIAINVGVSDLSQSDFATLGTTTGDTIVGTSGIDTIYGLAGADTITGGAGADTITPGLDNDTIVNADIENEGLDVIASFTTVADGAGIGEGADTLQFSDADLKGLTGFANGASATGTLLTFNDGVTKAELIVGAGAVADEAVATFAFDTSTNTLTFDADGTGVAASAIDVVTLTGVTDLAAGDFTFVA